MAQVVAGTGDVAPDVVERIRATVAAELPSLHEIFGHRELQRFFVHVHGSREEMPEALGASVHEDAPGFAQLGRHQIHLIWRQIVRTGSMPRGVVRHEMVHELLDQYVGKNGRHMPRWFHEGLAQLLAGDTYLGAREDDLVWRVGARSLPTFSSLSDGFPKSTTELRTAYAQSYSYVAWLAREYGVPMLLRVARNTDRRTTFGRALVAQTGRTTLQLEEAWRHYVVYGSGAPWRVLFNSWFSLLMIFALPVLVLALIRRLNSEERAARKLAARARSDRLAAERRAAEAEAAQQWALQQQALGLDPFGRRDEFGHEGDFEDRVPPQQLENEIEERPNQGRVEQDDEQGSV